MPSKNKNVCFKNKANFCICKVYVFADWEFHRKLNKNKLINRWQQQQYVERTDIETDEGIYLQ